MTFQTTLEQRLLRPIVFAKPMRLVHPPSWMAHIPFAFWIMSVLRSRTFVELGTQSGVSYSAFAQAVQTLGIETACHAIDTWRGDPQTGFYDESVFEEWSAFHAQHFAGFSRLMRSTFDEALAKFADQSVDLLHIDGLHTYSAVRHDFESWLPKVSERGVVLFHDINVRDGDFGAWKLWDEVQPRYGGFAFLHSHGLGVLPVGPSVPIEIRSLLQDALSQPESAGEIRRFFATLGDGIESRYQLSRLSEERDHQARRAADEREQLTRRLAEEEANAATAAVWTEDRTRLHAEVAALERQRDEQAEAYRQAIASLETAHANVRALERARREDEVRLRMEREGLTEMERRLHERTLELGRLQGDVDAERRRLTDRLGTLESAHHRATELLLEGVARTERQASEIASNREQMTALAAELTRRSDAAAAAHTEVAGLRSALTARDREVAVIRSSRQWRALAPARWARWTVRQIAQGDGGRQAGLLDALRLWVRPRVGRRAYIVAGGPWFDARRYAARARGVAARPLAALRHYLVTGEREGRSPHPLFDPGFYLATNPDVSAGASPLVHYTLDGQFSGRAPHPLFDPDRYRRLNPDVAASRMPPLEHYLTFGWREGRTPHALFDPAFYLAMQPDVREAGIEPLTHYLEHGWRELRAPHPLFDPAFYLATSPDVLRAGVEPLTHYLLEGARERGQPHPCFDALFYLAAYPEIDPAVVNPLVHFVDYGWREGRKPHQLFETGWYRETHLKAASFNPLVHFVLSGRHEGCAPNPWELPIAGTGLPDLLRRDLGWMGDRPHARAT